LKTIAIATAIAMLKTKPIGAALKQSGNNQVFLDKNFPTSSYTTIPKESIPHQRKP
jgi:hypothetical protein